MLNAQRPLASACEYQCMSLPDLFIVLVTSLAFTIVNDQTYLARQHLYEVHQLIVP